MRLQVLLSAMHLEGYEYIDSLHITGDCVVINQCGSTARPQHIERENGQRVTYVRTEERGLSRSRNRAIANADADICILCDNDVEYVEDYERIILDAFARNPQADIIVFFIKRKVRQQPDFPTERKMGFYSTMKIFSPEIAFRRGSLGGIRFDELFGAGAHYNFGEENIFLYDCLRAGLSIRYVPEQIAQLREEESTWFDGYTENYFINRGANYYAMSRMLSLPLIFQFALRKRGEYGAQMPLLRALRLMLKGRKQYKGYRLRLFLVGDYKTGTGPANVNQYYLRYLPADTLRQRCWNKLLRVMEIAYKTMRAHVVLCSGYSGQNIICMKWARLTGRPAVYLMHGCVEHENAINGVPDAHMNEVERKTMALADEIWAVSEPFACWLREHYPEHKEKISAMENGVDWQELEQGNAAAAGLRDRQRVISIGGGMPRKKIASICEGISYIHDTTGVSLRLTVIGAQGKDTERINSYPFVDNPGLVSFDRTKALLGSAGLFIQNSCFETFGLAPLEALACGCDILLSRAVGLIPLFHTIRQEDIIEDWQDGEEIGKKILHVLEHGNHDRLMEGIDKESVAWETRTRQLLERLHRITGRTL